MRYLVLMYNDPAAFASMTQEQQQAEYGAYMAFNAAAQAQNALRSAEQLQPTATATSLRIRDGKTLTTDGPYAETKEQLGGFYILDCANLDDAIALAKQIPAVKHGVIEIRPLLEGYQ
ncbi:MAG: YciI family protein [Armatimonadetes bacterium]|nr:YciI family protein [Anaerolineae bacterium]